MELAAIKDRLIIKLIGRKYQEELLKQVPYFAYMDLAVVFMLNEKEILTHDQIKELGMSKEQLLQIAIENTEYFFPAVFVTMEEVLSELTGESFESEKSSMYVLSNERKYLGAATLLYHNQLRKIGEKLKRDFFILPSSIHELIIIPHEGDTTKEELTKMVQEVNKTQLAAEDLLSDHAYFYKRNENLIYP